jgi:hypothetical protein
VRLLLIFLAVLFVWLQPLPARHVSRWQSASTVNSVIAAFGAGWCSFGPSGAKGGVWAGVREQLCLLPLHQCTIVAGGRVAAAAMSATSTGWLSTGLRARIWSASDMVTPMGWRWMFCHLQFTYHLPQE